MRKNLQIALILGMVLFLGACTKYSFLSMEKKLEGTWRFEKVLLRPGAFMGRVNVTKDFEKWEFTFERNGNVAAINSSNNEIKSGYWRMERYDDFYYEEDGTTRTETEYNLIFHLIDNQRNRENYVWKVGSITANKLRASEQMDKETYTYVMTRK